MRLVSILAFVGFASGCADHGAEGMFVLNNTAPPAGTVCTLTGEATQPFTSAGTVSYFATQLGTGYILTPLIKSRITTTNDSQINERTIHLEGANITLKKQPSGPSQSFTALFAGSLLPGATTNVSFELIPIDKITALGDPSQNTLVTADVEIYGTMGGGNISAEPFQYPVTIVAEGKGVVFGLGNGGSVPPTACTAATSVARTGNACNPAQDGAVDCCKRSDGELLCPAIPEMM